MWWPSSVPQHASVLTEKPCVAIEDATSKKGHKKARAISSFQNLAEAAACQALSGVNVQWISDSRVWIGLCVRFEILRCSEAVSVHQRTHVRIWSGVGCRFPGLRAVAQRRQFLQLFVKTCRITFPGNNFDYFRVFIFLCQFELRGETKKTRVYRFWQNFASFCVTESNRGVLRIVGKCMKTTM